MANIGQSILALLTGAGQGVQQAQAQAPINATNNFNLQQAQSGVSDDAAAMQYFTSIGLNGGGAGANPSPPTISPSGAGTPPVAGGSILPPSPGQSSTPMMSPPAAAPAPPPMAAPKPMTPPPAAPAPAAANQNLPQPPADNPMMASLQMFAPVLKDPNFQKLSPGAKKIVLGTLERMQQVQMTQKQQALRQGNEELLGKLRQKQLDKPDKAASGDKGMAKVDVQHAAGLKAEMQRLQTKADNLRSNQADPEIVDRAQTDADTAASRYDKFVTSHTSKGGDDGADEEAAGGASEDGPSQEDLEFTAKQNGITVDEVKAQLGIK